MIVYIFLQAVVSAFVYIPEFFTKFVSNSLVFTEPELLSTITAKIGFTNDIEQVARFNVGYAVNISYFCISFLFYGRLFIYQ